MKIFLSKMPRTDPNLPAPTPLPLKSPFQLHIGEKDLNFVSCLPAGQPCNKAFSLLQERVSHGWPKGCIGQQALPWLQYLGGFHVLAIMNNDAMNMGVEICFGEHVFNSLGEYIPRSGIAGSYVIIFLNFFRNCNTDFYSNHIFYIPKTVHKGSKFSTSWPTLVLFFFFFFFLFFDRCHPNECEMVSHCVSDLHFPNDY